MVATDMRPLGEAQRQVLAAVPALPVDATTLPECLGLVLAEAVTAPHHLPPFSNSAVDGYAVRVDDVAAAPVELRVIGEAPAGAEAAMSVTVGTAVKVMTGAPLPVGTEAIVRVEDTEASAADRVRILVPVAADTAVRPAGGDVMAGETVLTPGERLAPPHLGVLASLGVAHPLVRRRPRAAILSTGDELEPPETTALLPGKIRDANRFLLRGMLEELGAVVVDFGIVADDAADLEGVLAEASEAADVVVSSGGVSMGDYDVVKEQLAKRGTVDFWKVAMQPAKPFGFGRLGETPFFGLPGNPVSVVVAFEQFVRPALLHMMGATALFRPRVAAAFDDGAVTDPEKDVFLRAVAVAGPDGEWRARSAGGQSSNVLSAMAAANAFAVVPRGVGEIPPGGELTLELFRHPSTRTLEEALGG